MTKTEITSSPRPGRVAATITRNETRVGHVVCTGRTFTAHRKVGQTGVDIRRTARGFRTIEAAAAWVAKADA